MTGTEQTIRAGRRTAGELRAERRVRDAGRLAARLATVGLFVQAYRAGDLRRAAALDTVDRTHRPRLAREEYYDE